MALRIARSSIRTRVLTLALLPLGVVLPVLVAILAGWGGSYFDQLLITKVRSDLAVASGYYERVSAGMGSAVKGLAGSARLARLVSGAGRQPEALRQWLDETRVGLGLDFLHLLGDDGCPLAVPMVATNCFSDWPVVTTALQGRSRTETDVFPQPLLVSLAPRLAAQAHVPIVPTLNAAPDTRAAESRGLVLHAAAPVHDEDGRLLGILAGGVLLNRNLDFVDRLNEIVYPEKALPFGSVGTATLFLGDVRVATNVRLFEGARAIGTRVSSEVRDAVLQQGESWLARAFVVNDWYISGYQPLIDSHGQRIGMLYVGFLETPFAAAKQAGLVAILALFAVAMLLAGAFAATWGRRVFRPIERMHATMTAAELGDGGARVGRVDSEDEIGELATHLDRLLERQQAQAQALQRWGESLDGEVAKRTGELEAALADLKAAQDKLVMNEKLAAIGQLTAGVAHEINNPVAVIQGNLDVARELLGAAAKPVEPEIRLIQEQVHRIRLIVAKLLQFARPQDYAGYLEPVAIAPLFQDCLLLVGHLLRKSSIAIVEQVDTARQVVCNKNELQQVLINLIANAIQAMPQGGELRLLAEDWDEADMPVGVRLVVADSGPGIAPEELAQLFRPFYTAKKPGGHGLGLWVSKSLVERYGGDVTVDSAIGAGARFVVWLRCEPLA